MDDDRRSLWRHRRPLLLLAALSLVALSLSFLAGFSCDFLSVSSSSSVEEYSIGIFCANANEEEEMEAGMNEAEDSFDGGGGDGGFNRNAGTDAATNPGSATSSSGGSTDTMTILSRTFLSLAWACSVPAAVLACALALFLPPTDSTYRALSILSGMGAILSVPSFLLLESDACQVGGNGQCGLDVGAYYLIVAAALHALVSAMTALTAPPGRYYEMRDNWTIGRKGGVVHRAVHAVEDGWDHVAGAIRRRSDWRLRYVGTEEDCENGDGPGGLERYGLMDESSDVGEGEDDDAREMREDGDLLDHLEAGELTGLTIEYEGGVEEGGAGGGGAGEAAAIAGGAAALAAGGAAAYAATKRRDSQQSQKQDPPGKVLVSTSLERSVGEQQAAAPALVTPTSLGATTTAEYPPLAEHSDEGEQSSIDGDSSMYTTTDDEASKMVQLQTSRLDEIGDGGDLGVVYKDRPPAYDMDSPHVIHDEHHAAQEQAKLDDGQQYYADEGALAPPSDVEENRLMVSDVDDDSDISDDDDGGDDDGGRRANAGAGGAAASSSKSLRDKSRSLRTSIQALSRKLGDNMTVDNGLSIRGKAAYVAMGVPSDDGGSRISSSSDSSERLSQFCDELEKGSQTRTPSRQSGSVDEDDISADADDEYTDDEADSSVVVREEGGIAFVRVDSNLSNLSNLSRRSTSSAAKARDLDESSENFNANVSSMIEESLGAVDTSGELSPPPPPPSEEPTKTQTQENKYADPPMMHYPSESEAEHSDTNLSEIIAPGNEEMPEDELEAYTSDGGSSWSSYTSDGNSSVSSYGGSEDEKDKSAVIAGVLEENNKRKKKKPRSRSGRTPDGRRRRRRKKKRSRRFSSNRSIGSQSLLDETIEEETDMDLMAMEDSSEEDKMMQNNTTILEDPHGLLPTDGLIAGASGIGEDTILNTIVETSFAKDGANEDEENDEHKDRQDGYESGYLTRSPAPSDSESKLDFIRKAVTPSPSPRKPSSYRSLAIEDDAAYYSAPEGNDTLFTSYSTRSPPIRKPEDKGYTSDTGKDLQSQEFERSAVTVSDSSIDGNDAGSQISAPDVLAKPVEMTRARSNLSLPSTLHQHRSSHVNDDSSIDGSVTSAIYRYEMPTSWKAEKKNRSPLHNTDTYFSDSSSNTDSSQSARTSASRQARIARKKRLSLGGGATAVTSRARTRAAIPSGQARVRSSTLEPPMDRKSLATSRLSNRHYSPRRSEKPPTPTGGYKSQADAQRADILADIEDALYEL